MFVGSQVRSTADRNAPAALSVFRFDEEDGSASPLAALGGIDNPTWVTIDAARRRLYATSEVVEWNEGTVSAYDIDPATGKLAYLNKQTTLGNCTCHLGLSPDGRYLAAANYADDGRGDRPDQSIALYALGAEDLPPAIARARHQGRGPLPDRQARPHAHCALFTPDGRHLFVADLGLDRLVAYRVGERGELVAAPELDVVFEPGRGPRHIVLHPDGKTLFVVHELTPGVSVVSLEDGGSRLLWTVDLAYPQQVYPAAVVMSPDGRFLYTSVRVTGEIVGLSIGEDRRLAEIGRWACGGTWPRDARLSPSGRFLLVANQDVGKLTVLPRDAATGQLGAKVAEVELPAPMCVTFLSV